jgi:uncharacterized protein
MIPSRSAFPFQVRAIEHVAITLSDGTQLSARILMPEDAHERAVPAILEYMPYRKRDHNRNRDQMVHHYFAGYGYACVRVDTRGSGESEGILTDEFTKQQTDDGVELVNWIASQPWCSGAVGMIGKSWSGFSALQVAARAPEPLKAIIPVCAGVDRYRQGLHYSGGCLLADNLHWTTTMLMFNLRPPDPLIVGEQFAAIWRQRCEGNQPWMENWLQHQTDDDYYREGSVLHDAAKFRCAIYFVGGWFDHFAGAVPEAIETFPVAVRGLVGPWAHHFGYEGEPGPQMGWLQDCLRWWDQWLKGKDTGISREPAYLAWLLEPPVPPEKHAPCNGRWVAEPTWPSPNIQIQEYLLGDRILSKDQSCDLVFQHRSPLSLGMAAGGDYCRLGVVGEAPLDQSEDDARSLVFDSDALSERLEILGAPVLRLALSVDAKVAMIAVRLNDVAPDGTSSRISYGFLNLTHRDSHSHPTPLEPGKIYSVCVKLNHIGYAFLPGHRIRIAVSSSYWPFVWPAPTPVTLLVHTRGSSLGLPVRSARFDEPLIEFAPPEVAEPTPITILEPASITRKFTRDLLTGLNTLTLHYSGGYIGPGRFYRIEATGMILGHEKTHSIEILDDDPLSARYVVSQIYDMQRDGKRIRITARITMWATLDRFFTDIETALSENDVEFWAKRWSNDYPRNLV